MRAKFRIVHRILQVDDESGHVRVPMKFQSYSAPEPVFRDFDTIEEAVAAIEEEQMTSGLIIVPATEYDWVKE